MRERGLRRLPISAAIAWAMCAGEVHAQTAADAPSLAPHHVTLSAGALWTGGYPIGDAMAQLRGNAVGPTAPPFTLFRAESSLDASVGVDARAGFALTRGLTIELGLSYHRPGITTELSQDAEAPAATIEAERLSQYVVDVGAIWQIPRVIIAGRMRPFVRAGGGYLRQLYEDRTLVETGSIYYAGGGVRFWLRGGDGQRRSVGLRADGSARWRVDGVEFEGKTRVAPVVTLHAFVEF